MIQFGANLKRVKEAIKQWIPIWRAKRQREILEIKEILSGLHRSIDDSGLSEAKLEEINLWRKINPRG
jgi:hypothetical protein